MIFQLSKHKIIITQLCICTYNLYYIYTISCCFHIHRNLFHSFQWLCYPGKKPQFCCYQRCKYIPRLLFVPRSTYTYIYYMFLDFSVLFFLFSAQSICDCKGNIVKGTTTKICHCEINLYYNIYNNKKEEKLWKSFYIWVRHNLQCYWCGTFAFLLICICWV